MNYCSHKVLDRDIILLNPSAGERVVGFNPFRKAGGGSVAVQVAGRIAATLHAWNVASTDQTPDAGADAAADLHGDARPGPGPAPGAALN